MVINNNLKYTLDLNEYGCPHCNSTHVIKYGKFKSKQRFLCKDCNKTFSIRTNSPWYYSKKDNDTWKEFWNLQIEKTPLRICAEKLNINIATAFSWRHKILNTLKISTEPKTIKGNIFMTKRVLHENFKGSNKSKTILKVKKDHNLIVIVSGDDNDDCLVQPICLDRWDKNSFSQIVLNKVEFNSFIFTGGDRYLALAARGGYDFNNPYQHEYIDALVENKKLIKPARELVTNIINNYRDINNKARGVATKYLSRYFSLAKIFSLKENFSFSTVFNKIYTKDVFLISKKIGDIVALQ